jgi:hypothetical protein
MPAECPHGLVFELRVREMAEQFQVADAGATTAPEEPVFNGPDLLAEGQAMNFQNSQIDSDVHDGNPDGPNTNVTELDFNDDIYGMQPEPGKRVDNQTSDGTPPATAAPHEEPKAPEPTPMYEYRGRLYDRRVTGPRVPGGHDL